MKQNVVNIANKLSQAGVNSQYGVIKLIGLELPFTLYNSMRSSISQ